MAWRVHVYIGLCRYILSCFRQTEARSNQVRHMPNQVVWMTRTSQENKNSVMHDAITYIPFAFAHTTKLLFFCTTWVAPLRSFSRKDTTAFLTKSWVPAGKLRKIIEKKFVPGTKLYFLSNSIILQHKSSNWFFNGDWMTKGNSKSFGFVH